MSLAGLRYRWNAVELAGFLWWWYPYRLFFTDLEARLSLVVLLISLVAGLDSDMWHRIGVLSPGNCAPLLCTYQLAQQLVYMGPGLRITIVVCV